MMQSDPIVTVWGFVMAYWMDLLHLPPSQMDIIVFACIAVLFTRVKPHLRLHQSAFAALLTFLVITSALPHLSDKGMFSFRDFGESLFSTPFGLIMSRYAAFFPAIWALRQISKRYLPKKLFFKN